MSDQPENVILAMRVGDMVAGHPPGSRTDECSVCHSPVWIAPSSDKLAQGWRVICLPCGLEMMKQARQAGEEPVFINPSPTSEQMNEIRQVLGTGTNRR